jgi:dCTP deaminase
VILSDRDILNLIKNGKLIIDPFDEIFVQPSSLDITLASKVRVFDNHDVEFIDVRKVCDPSRVIELGNGGSFVIHPSDFILASTAERITLPTDIAAKIEGRSSLGRLGLIIHATAGYVDPGFSGHLTLEISNISRLPIKLYSGMRIGQMAFIKMSSPVINPYGSPKLRSKYQGQSDPTPSKVWKDFNEY